MAEDLVPLPSSAPKSAHALPATPATMTSSKSRQTVIDSPKLADAGAEAAILPTRRTIDSCDALSAEVDFSFDTSKISYRPDWIRLVCSIILSPTVPDVIAQSRVSARINPILISSSALLRPVLLSCLPPCCLFRWMSRAPRIFPFPQMPLTRGTLMNRGCTSSPAG